MKLFSLYKEKLTRHALAFVVISTIIGVSHPILISSCAKSGQGTKPQDPGKDPDDRRPDDDDATPARTTPVGLTKLDVSRFDTRSCPNRQAIRAPVRLEAPLNVDGDLEKWSEISQFVFNSTSGNTAELAIKYGKLARYDTTVYGAWRIANAEQGPYAIEFTFGRLLNNEQAQELEYDLLRRYRIDHRGLRQWNESTQQFLPPHEDRGFAVIGDHGVEWRIPTVMLEGVLFQPLWHLQAKLIVDDEVIDSTMVQYAPNTLAHDTGFRIGTCLASASDPTSFRFTEIFDFNMAAEAKHEHIFSIVRMAYASVQLALNRPQLPVSGITVVLTDRATRPMPELITSETTGRERLYHEFVVDGKLYTESSLEPYPDAVVFNAAIERFIMLIVEHHLPKAPDYLRRMITRQLKNTIIKARLGRAYWLDHWRLNQLEFLANPDTIAPETIPQRYATLLTSPSSLSGQQDYLEYLGKTNGFGHLLTQYVPLDVQLRVLRELKELRAEAHEILNLYYEQLSAHLNEARRQTLHHLWAGWIDGDVYHEGHSPRLLSDDDFDGVPKYLELAMGSNPNKNDTDGDGWSDYAHFVTGTDPSAITSNPGTILADNHFGDWQVLLPNRVSEDPGTSATGCPKSADITFFGGLASETTLIIGAAAKDMWQEPPHVRWEADLEIASPEGRKLYTLRAVSGRYYYELLDNNTRTVLKRFYRAMPLGLNVMEWAIESHQLGLPKEYSFTARGAVRFRLKTVYERTERILCDDTVWTLPLISEAS